MKMVKEFFNKYCIVCVCFEFFFIVLLYCCNFFCSTNRSLAILHLSSERVFILCNNNKIVENVHSHENKTSWITKLHTSDVQFVHSISNKTTTIYIRQIIYFYFNSIRLEKCHYPTKQIISNKHFFFIFKSFCYYVLSYDVILYTEM